MEREAKYVWDITVEKQFTNEQMAVACKVSQMISRGGEVQELRGKLLQLGLLKK